MDGAEVLDQAWLTKAHCQSWRRGMSPLCSPVCFIHLAIQRKLIKLNSLRVYIMCHFSQHTLLAAACENGASAR